MPNYHFVCLHCEEETNVLCTTDNYPDKVNCPKCGKKMKRTWGPVAISFKGSGFHSTDYPRKINS